MITTPYAQSYLALFKGKKDSYVHNELPNEAPKPGVKAKTRVTTLKEEITKEVMLDHLNGKYGVGMCPVLSDGTCNFAVLDIDFYQQKILKVLDFIRDYQLPLVPFRSKSGGLHVYLFLKKSVAAKDIQAALKRIIATFGLDKLYGTEKVEVFPKQTKAEGCGSSITLPYFQAENPYTYLIDNSGEALSLKDAITYIQSKTTTLEELDDVLDNLPYNDAPVCIQRILITKAVGGEDSGRNNFLFNFAVYAKKKYGDDFEEYVKDINNSFDDPIDEYAVEKVIESVKNNEYIYRCGDIPCKGFCDKKLCKHREFSHLNRERNKGHFTGIEYGQLYRYMTAEPYYEWDLRLVGQEEWKKVVFRSEKDLRNQDVFSDMCMRYLKVVPFQVSKNDWASTLNTVLPNSIDIEVKEEFDTSGAALIKEQFRQFLANRQSDRETPYMVKMGLCYMKEVMVEGKLVNRYYFTHSGFEKYLSNKKQNFDTNMMHNTLVSYGVKEDVLEYTSVMGEQVQFPCWSKDEDQALRDTRTTAKEIELADKKGLIGGMEVQSVSEANDALSVETTEEEAPYTQEDFDNVKKML